MPRKYKPPRLPPSWVRRADWLWAGGDPVFRFPCLAHNEPAELAQLDRLWIYAEDHPEVFRAWMSKVDTHRGPELACACPQCLAQLEGRA